MQYIWVLSDGRVIWATVIYLYLLLSDSKACVHCCYRIVFILSDRRVSWATVVAFDFAFVISVCRHSPIFSYLTNFGMCSWDDPILYQYIYDFSQYWYSRWLQEPIKKKWRKKNVKEINIFFVLMPFKS